MSEVTQRTITSRQAVNPSIQAYFNAAGTGTTIPEHAWLQLETDVLRHRVKFPVLEHIAEITADQLNASQINDLMDRAAMVKHISAYPLIGKLLQLRLEEDLNHTFLQAITQIIQGNEWYACDIISERVFGEGLLKNFSAAYEILKKMGDHDNMWIQRSIGIATHYATKKGLPESQVELLFLLIFEHGHKTQLYIKKGIGWPAKTISKYHPELVYKHKDLILQGRLSKWFKNKINIGLVMAKHPPLNYE